MTVQTIEQRVTERKKALAEAKAERADLEALATLIENGGVATGPYKTIYVEGVKEIVVGIGKDHTATIRLFPDDLAALGEILGRDLNYEDLG